MWINEKIAFSIQVVEIANHTNKCHVVAIVRFVNERQIQDNVA